MGEADSPESPVYHVFIDLEKKPFRYWVFMRGLDCGVTTSDRALLRGVIGNSNVAKNAVAVNR